MDTGEHTTSGEHVHDEQNADGPALTELRRKLSDGLARMELTKTQLVARSKLGRTTGVRILSGEGR